MKTKCVACWSAFDGETEAGLCPDCRQDGAAMRAGDDMILVGERMLRDASVRLEERRAKNRKESKR